MIMGACLVMLGEVVDGQFFCVSADFEALDSHGGLCDDGTYNNANNCGLYDDVDFTANQMCCDCEGGIYWDPGSLDEEWDVSLFHFPHAS